MVIHWNNIGSHETDFYTRVDEFSSFRCYLICYPPFVYPSSESTETIYWWKFVKRFWGKTIFSLLEPKAQVSFSDHNLSVVCRRGHILFTFSSSTEPRSQFVPNVAQSILEWSKFTLVQMKAPPFLEEIITKRRKYSNERISAFNWDLVEKIRKVENQTFVHFLVSIRSSMF